MSVPILALDLATLCGWAQLVPGLPPITGLERFTASANRVERIRAAEDWLPSMLESVAHGRGEVAYETTVGRSRAAARSAFHLEACLISACRSMGVTVLCDYMPADVKKAATGKGTATKEEVAAAMRERWGLSGLLAGDEADALAVLSLHLDSR